MSDSNCDHVGLDVEFDQGEYTFKCTACDQVVLRDPILPRALYQIDRMTLIALQVATRRRQVESIDTAG